MDFKTTPDIDPAIWEHYYEAAIATRNPEVRLPRIAEAQALILRRAEALEEGEATDAECQALEDAAEFLQGLRLASIGDGAGKQVEVGDVEPTQRMSGSQTTQFLKASGLPPLDALTQRVAVSLLLMYISPRITVRTAAINSLTASDFTMYPRAPKVQSLSHHVSMFAAQQDFGRRRDLPDSAHDFKTAHIGQANV